VEGRLMNPLRSVLPLLAVLLAATARADEPKKFEVETVKDLAYNDDRDADAVKHKLDLYLPKGRKDFPVLFFVHGGTWKSGDKKIYAPLGETFAAQGLGTVIINYRLSPKVKHPAHVEDVARAFAWTCAHIAQYGGRADDLFVMGHSAGGHLVSLLATDQSYLKAQQRSLADVKGVISISGVYTIVPLGALASAFGTDPEVCKKASPINNVGDKEPPFLILYADADLPLLGAMAENMARALKDHKGEVSTLQVAHRDHVSIIKSILNPDDPARLAILDFVKGRTEKK
jgi:acetyl esterase/lipase